MLASNSGAHGPIETAVRQGGRWRRERSGVPSENIPDVLVGSIGTWLCWSILTTRQQATRR